MPVSVATKDTGRRLQGYVNELVGRYNFRELDIIEHIAAMVDGGAAKRVRCRDLISRRRPAFGRTFDMTADDRASGGIVPATSAPNWKNRTLWTRDNLEVMRGFLGDALVLGRGRPDRLQRLGMDPAAALQLAEQTIRAEAADKARQIRAIYPRKTPPCPKS